MTHKAHQPWSSEDLHRAISMRRACIDPQVIAEALGRTLPSVRQKLSQTKMEFPQLRHGRLKYDKATVARWREMERAGSSRKQIAEKEGVHHVIISKKYAQELYGELVH